MDEILEGANVQEVAAPEGTNNQVEGTGVNTAGEQVKVQETAAAGQEGTQPQSAELNAQFAAARRKAEEEAKMHREGIDAEFRRLFGSLKNPVTGKPINGYADYLQAVEYKQKEAQNKMLQDKGIDPAFIEQMINNSPAMRQAQLILEQNSRSEAQRQLDLDLKAVSQFAPEIKNIGDLANHESYETILGYIRSGLNLVDAFKLANFDSISARNAGAAKQAAINQAKSKNHMETTSGIVNGLESLSPIPESVLEMWKSAYPELSMEQLTKKYNSAM